MTQVKSLGCHVPPDYQMSSFVLLLVPVSRPLHSQGWVHAVLLLQDALQGCGCRQHTPWKSRHSACSYCPPGPSIHSHSSGPWSAWADGTPPHIHPYCLHLLYRPMKFSWPLLISLPTSGCCCSDCICPHGVPHQPGGNDREVVQPGHGPNPPDPKHELFLWSYNKRTRTSLLHQRTLWAFSVGRVCIT